MEDKILISEYVKNLRAEEGLNMRDFASKYNVSKALIGKYENGKCDKPSIVVATKFCNTFKISFNIFSADFYYEDERIKSVFQTAAHLKKRIGSEWLDSYLFTTAKNLYVQFHKEYGLTGYEESDYFKDVENTSVEDVYIDHSAKCLTKNGEEEIWICPYLRVPEFRKTPRNVNYDYMLAEIASAAALSKEKLKCKNFIFITSSKEMFNYFASLEFHSFDTSAYLVFSEDSKHFEKPHKLYGEAFLEK